MQIIILQAVVKSVILDFMHEILFNPKPNVICCCNLLHFDEI